MTHCTGGLYLYLKSLLLHLMMQLSTFTAIGKEKAKVGKRIVLSC